MLFYRIGELFEHIAVERSRTQIMDAVDMRPETVNLVCTHDHEEDDDDCDCDCCHDEDDEDWDEDCDFNCDECDHPCFDEDEEAGESEEKEEN